MPDWISIALAAGGVGTVAAYVRRTGQLGGIGLFVTVAAHGALLLLPVSLPPARSPLPPVEFEVATEIVRQPIPEPPPEPAPQPEPAADPEPTPPPRLEPKPEPKPKPRPKSKRQPKRSKKAAPTPAPEPASPAPLRFDLTATTQSSQSGVVVTTGKPTQPSGPISKAGGTGNGRGTGKGQGQASGAAPSGAPQGKGKDWNPGSSASLASLPVPLNVPKIVCPATESKGVTGTVKLRVQVRANGRVRNVRVVERLGSGCDAVAKRALQRAKFRPAKRMGGKPTDYEISYEYVFSTR